MTHSLILSFAQDVIYKIDGAEIKAKITDITTETIKYKKYEQQDGPIRNILISDVFMIIYENGTREVFKENTTSPKNEGAINQTPQNIPKEEYFEDARNELSMSDKCMKGESDAEVYHGKTGTHVLLGIAFGGFAVIGAAVSEPTPEKGNSTSIMSKNRELFQDPVYRNCYIKKARKRNVGNAALGWASWGLFLIVIAGAG